MYTLRYVRFKEIDPIQWNDCINRSANQLIYATYEYLTIMSENWDAIVLNEYEAVMPLTWKKKWGIRYLYQPAFFQQGGIYSSLPLPENKIIDFIDLAAKNFRFAEITLNYHNSVDRLIGRYQIKQRNNFILPLDKKYNEIEAHYDPDIRYSLKKIDTSSIIYAHQRNFRMAIQEFKNKYHSIISELKNADFKQFEKLCDHYDRQEKLVVREALDTTNNKRLAIFLLINDGKRLYNIISYVSDEGKKRRANYFLYDSLIREFSATGMLLDFEGSDLEGVAFFYKKFGGVSQPYPFMKFNNLPKILRLIKS